jgi:hypothetical protein
MNRLSHADTDLQQLGHRPGRQLEVNGIVEISSHDLEMGDMLCGLFTSGRQPQPARQQFKLTRRTEIPSLIADFLEASLKHLVSGIAALLFVCPVFGQTPTTTRLTVPSSTTSSPAPVQAYVTISGTSTPVTSGTVTFCPAANYTPGPYGVASENGQKSTLRMV